MANATIVNDDYPKASLAPATVSVLEGDSGTTPLAYDVTISGISSTDDLPFPVTVGYSLSGTGTFPADTGDFSGATSGSVTFNGMERTKTFTIDVAGDTVPEPDEEFKVMITPGSNVTVDSANDESLGKILNDDKPTASIALVSASPQDEGNPSGSASTYTFEVSLSSPPGGSGSTVNYSVVPGTGAADPAQVPADFDSATYPLSGSVSFDPTESSKMITVEVNRDTEIEPDEEFEVELSLGSDVVISSSAGSAAATIRNDDFPVASLSPASLQATEGTGGTTTMSYTVSIDGPSGIPLPFTVNVDYSVVGTGMYPTNGSDFSGGTSGTVSFSGMERTKTIDLLVNTDSMAEPDEEFMVTISVPTGGNATVHPMDYQADGKILNDDKPTVSIVLGMGESDEKDEGNPGSSPVTFTFDVTLNSPPGSMGASVDYSVVGINPPVEPANDPADPASDFQPATGGTVNFGATDDSATITVTINPDYAIENDEEFEVVLSNPDFLIIDPLADSAAATILDDDTPEVSLAVTDSEARERNGDQFGWLTLSRMGGDPGIPLSVSFTTEESGSPPTPGIADLGSDYSLASPTAGAVSYSGSAGTFTIPAWATSIDIELTALRDFLMEGDETATITLTPSTQYDITPGSESGDVTVKDSPHIRIEATEPAAFESTTTGTDTLGPKNGEYTLTLVNASAGPVDAVFEWNTPAPGLGNPPSSLGPSVPPELTDKDYDLSGGYSATPDGGEATLTGTATLLTLMPVDDSFVEGAEDAILTLIPDDAKYVIESGYESATVTIFDTGLLVLTVDDSGIEHEEHPDGECDCECGGEESPDELSFRYSDDNANPTLSLTGKTPVLPPLASGSGGSAPAGGGAAAPLTVAAPHRLRVSLTAFPPELNPAPAWSDTVYFDLTGHSVNDNVQFADQFDVSSLGTDYYTIEVGVTTVYDDGSESHELKTSIGHGVLNLKNAPGIPGPDSPDLAFGQGWSKSRIKRIKERDMGVWYAPGDGTIHWFKEDGGSYEAPKGSYLELEKVGDEFVLTDKFYTRFTFNAASGLVTQEKDRNDRVTTYYRESANSTKLLKIENHYGSFRHFNYSNGNLVSIQDFDGIVYTFGYNPATNQLDWIDTPDPDGSGAKTPIRTSFVYDANGLLIDVIKDDNGVEKLHTTYSRNASGIATSTSVTNNGVTAVSPRSPIVLSVAGAGLDDPSLGTFENPLPLSTIDLLEGSETDPAGIESTYEMDWNGNVTTRASGAALAVPDRVFKYEYNDDDLPIKETVPGTASGDLTYEYDYDARGNLTLVKEIPGDGSAPRTWTWTYDTMFSQVTSYTDEFGRLTDYTLDGNGNVTTITEPDPDGNGPLGNRVTTISYYGGAILKGLVNTITEPDPDGSGPLESPQTRFEYSTKKSPDEYLSNRAGNVVRVLRKTPDGTLTIQEQYKYNGTNRLIDVGDEKSPYNVHDWLDLSAHNGLKQPQVVIEAPGTSEARQTMYRYDGYGRITQIIQQDPAGGTADGPTYDFTYDGFGQLTEVKAPEITVVLPNGTTTLTRPTTTYTYDFNGNLTSITDPNNNLTEFIYDYENRTLEEHWSSPDGIAPQTIVVSTWNERDLLVSRTIEDPDNPGSYLLDESYDYDGYDRLLAVNDLLRGTTTSYAYDGPGLDGPNYAVVDARGHATRYEFNDLDWLTRVVQPKEDSPPGATVDGPVWEYVYDALGRLTEARDPLYSSNSFRKTTYQYDVLSRLTNVTLADPDGSGPLAAPSMTYTYDATHNVETETDHVGRVTTHTYDRLSQRKTTTLPSPNYGQPDVSVLEWHYDQLGRLDYSIDQRGETTDYSWNDASWLESVTLPDPDGATGALPSPVFSYGYDANGALRTASQPGPNGNILTTSYGYDDLGRVVSVNAPEVGSNTGALATATTKYDGIGRAVKFTDPLGNITDYDYNDAALQVSVTRGNNLDGSTDGLTTTVSTYDAVGNLIELQDGSGNLTTFDYDALNRLDKENDPFGKVIDYNYDDAGNLTKEKKRYVRQSNGNSAQIKYVYDNLNRVTRENWHSTSNSQANYHSVRYGYDDEGRLASVDELRGSQSATPNPEYRYEYDDLDRLINVIDTANSGAFEGSQANVNVVPVSLDYGYNSDGDLASTDIAIDRLNNGTFEADLTNSFSHDALGRVTQLVQSGTAAVGQPTIARKRVDIAYNTAGQFGEIVRSVGAAGSETEVATGSYSYLDGGGLQQIAYTHSGATLTTPDFPTGLPAGNSLSTYSWTYDSAGRVASFTAPEGTFSYGYDNTHQITSANYSVASGYTGYQPDDETWQWDATGNIDDGEPITGNRDTTIDDTAYYYDDEGNIVWESPLSDSSKRKSFYDVRDRLVRVEDYDASNTLTQKVWYTYDAFDRRVYKRVDSNGDGTIDSVERFVWDGAEVVMVLDESGNVEHRFLHGPGIDQVFADESAADGLLWYLTDNQNTVRDVAKDDGTGTVEVVNHLTYSAFGKILSEENPNNGNSDASALTPFFAYTGRDWDEDIQLQYNRARWYDPDTGRWRSEDPIRWAAGDENLYRYVGNSPTNYTDPSGLFPNDFQLPPVQRHLGIPRTSGGSLPRSNRPAHPFPTDNAAEAAFVGAAQGAVNTANGVTDSLIGLANLPAGFVNGIAYLEEKAGILDGGDGQRIRIPYFPAPDWSRGALCPESDGVHDWSKFLGGFGVDLLIGSKSPKPKPRPKPKQTGAKLLDPSDFDSWDAAEKAYDAIRRTSDDIDDIVKNSGIPREQVQRVKDHLFNNTHKLDDGVIGQFDAHPEIVNAWNRLRKGTGTSADRQLFQHERAESIFEKIFDTTYRQAHESVSKKWPSGLE